MVIWVIGLAGAGKTTLGRALSERLRKERSNVVYLDGDHFREIMGENLGHTLQERRKNADRICRLCRFFDAQGIDVVCAVLSMFQESREWNRQNYSSYFEVYLEVPMKELERRDQKGLYSGASEGRIHNVVGVDLEFTPPSDPDLVIENVDPLDQLDQRVESIVARLGEKFA
jgi:adenylylsulfate kinase